MPPPLLAAAALTKDYGRARALDALTLRVEPGEVVGLLGPNGSGKTTALRLFLGFLRPTRGTAALGGFDCWTQSVEARRLVAYLPGELRLYENMTGRQLLAFLARLRGDPPGDVDALARRFDVDPDRPLTGLSSGMKRKVALLSVLLPRVPLLILDEPTNALDPAMRDQFLDRVRAAKAAGQAVLFSSHVLQEVEAVCDRVAILRRGKLVGEKRLDDLRGARRVTATLLGSGPRPDRGPNGEPVELFENAAGSRLTVESRGPLPDLLDWLRPLPLTDLKVEPLGLGGFYLSLHPPEGGP